MLDLLADEPLQTARWFDLGQRVADGIAQTLLVPLESGHTHNGVPFIRNTTTQKAAILGHPLWHRHDDSAVPHQTQAATELKAAHRAVAQSDVFIASRRPLTVIRQLT